MDTELRAPDPTLGAIEPDALIGLDYSQHEPLIGHTVMLIDGHDVPDCDEGAGGGLDVVQARHARWFAVPCRECFPDAPQPGELPRCHDNCAPLTISHLAWQLA